MILGRVIPCRNPAGLHRSSLIRWTSSSIRCRSQRWRTPSHFQLGFVRCCSKENNGSEEMLIRRADKKIALSVHKMKAGTPTHEGIHFFYHMAGLFGQRLWFYKKRHHTNKSRILTIQNVLVAGVAQSSVR